MEVTGVSITLANSIIGVGILAMPFCFQQCGIILATLILILMGLVSRLCCYFLLKCAILTRRRNYEFLAFHIFGTAGKTAIEMGIIGFLMGTCVAYFVVVGDLGPQIIAKMLNINQSDILRTSIMVIVSVVCVLPLGLLRNVESFSKVSAATIAFYVCLVVKVIAEAASQMSSTDWTSHIELWRPAGVLQCVPIFSMALFCQTQLFEVFESWPTASLDKMCLVTKNAINICSAVYFTLGVFGYIAFGAREISGNVLVSLSPTVASDVIKLGFVASLAVSFPLVIFPCRESLYSFFYRTAHASSDRSAMSSRAHRSLTAAIVGASLCLGVALPAVERVLGALGASAGAAVCVLGPAALQLRVGRGGRGGERDSRLARLVLALGLALLLLGTVANVGERRDAPGERGLDDLLLRSARPHETAPRPRARVAALRGQGGEGGEAAEQRTAGDSEVQPPNPVPPGPHSAGDAPPHSVGDVPPHSAGDVPPHSAGDAPPHFAGESPPPGRLENGESVAQVLSQEEIAGASVSRERKVQSAVNEERVVNVVEKNEAAIVNAMKPKESEPQSSRERLDMIKQQRLIETIKQHGEEQRELIKEQKEILDELKKTKDELKKNKEDTNTNEAKKIAVESIQKIANVAIKSLVGDSDESKHNGDSKPEEPIANIVNKAVSDIAKKAEETLDAIKKKDGMRDDKHSDSKISKNNKLHNNISVNDKENQNIPSAAKTTQENKAIKREISNSNSIKPAIQEQSNNLEKPREENENNQVIENVKTKEHIHMPDEPQSYKRGEDIQKDVQKNLPNGNIPQDAVKKVNDVKINKVVDGDKKNENVQNGGIIYKESNILKDIANGNIIPRRKREVVDCTEEMLLKAEDKQICLNLANKQNDKSEDVFLKDVNLGEVGLSNSLPLQAVALHHLRTLKNIDEDKKR